MNLYSLLDENTILTDADVSNKEELLNALIDALGSQVDEQQLEDIRKSVFQRERIMSTGVGKNLAIPHGKVSSIEKNYASFAILNNPVEFGSVDQQPVKLAFLLVGPENNNSMHIKLLSRISRLMNSTVFRQKLEKCTTPEEVYNAFYNEERRYFGG